MRHCASRYYLCLAAPSLAECHLKPSAAASALDSPPRPRGRAPGARCILQIEELLAELMKLRKGNAAEAKHRKGEVAHRGADQAARCKRSCRRAARLGSHDQQRECVDSRRPLARAAYAVAIVSRLPLLAGGGEGAGHRGGQIRETARPGSARRKAPPLRPRGAPTPSSLPLCERIRAPQSARPWLGSMSSPQRPLRSPKEGCAEASVCVVCCA